MIEGTRKAPEDLPDRSNTPQPEAGKAQGKETPSPKNDSGLSGSS